MRGCFAIILLVSWMSLASGERDRHTAVTHIKLLVTVAASEFARAPLLHL